MSIQGFPGRTVRAGLRDGEQEWQAQTDDGRMEILVPEAKLWSAEEPNLYELTLSLMDGGKGSGSVIVLCRHPGDFHGAGKGHVRKRGACPS